MKVQMNTNSPSFGAFAIGNLCRVAGPHLDMGYTKLGETVQTTLQTENALMYHVRRLCQPRNRMGSSRWKFQPIEEILKGIGFEFSTGSNRNHADLTVGKGLGDSIKAHFCIWNAKPEELHSVDIIGIFGKNTPITLVTGQKSEQNFAQAVFKWLSSWESSEYPLHRNIFKEFIKKSQQPEYEIPWDMKEALQFTEMIHENGEISPPVKNVVDAWVAAVKQKNPDYLTRLLQ